MTRTLCEHMQSLFPDIAPDSDHIGSGQYSGEQRDHYTSTSRPMVSAQQAFSRRLAKYLLDEKFRQSVELGRYFDLACRRISRALDAPDMFIEQPKPAEAVSNERHTTQ